MRPNKLVARTYLMRGARLWLAIRLLLSVVFLLAGSNPLRLSVAVVIVLIFLSVFVSILETHRHRERVLLGNLGVSASMLTMLFTGPPLIGETALILAASAFE